MVEFNESSKGNDHTVEISVNTTQGTMQSSFLKTAKIQDVINVVIAFFHFAPSGSYELRKDTDPQVALKPERTLISYQVTDGEVLIFTDLGIAV